MYKQKHKEQEKAYEKQVKEIKAKKAAGQSKKSAVSANTAYILLFARSRISYLCTCLHFPVSFYW